MKMLKNVVFFGTESFSTPTLRALIDAGHHIAYVVTKPDTLRGRNRTLESPEVKKVAQEYDIAVLQPQKLSEISTLITELGQPVGVLVAYGKIIPQSVIDLFSPGIINVHPSLLPKYRGPAPIEAAILHGDAETGISIMQLSAAMDAGPIYSQQVVPLNSGATKPELYQLLSSQGAELLVAQIESIADFTKKPVPQKIFGVSYTTLLIKEDGKLNPETETAEQLERKVRAYLGYPKTRIPIHDIDVIITSAKVVASLVPDTLTLSCKDGTYLQILELVAPSGKKMNAGAFIRGYKSYS